jgi:hypothetical protein
MILYGLVTFRLVASELLQRILEYYGLC